MAQYLKKAVKGAGASFIMGMFAALVGYLVRLVLARTLDTSEFGLFYSVLTFVLFFLFLRDLGLQEALVKYMSHYQSKKDYNSIKTIIVSVLSLEILGSCILAILFIVFSKFLSVHYFADPGSIPILRILIFYVFFSIFFRILKGIFQGYQKMLLYSSMELAKNLFVFIGILLFVKITPLQIAPAYAYFFSAFLMFLVYLPFAFRLFNPFKHKMTHFMLRSKELLSFGVHSFATVVGGRIIGYADTIILTYFVSLSDVGIYNAVLPSALMFFFLGRAVSSIAFPMSSELWSKNDTQRLAEGVGLIHRYIFILIIPLLGITFVFARFLITVFFGAAYASGDITFQIVLVGTLFYIVAMMNNNILLGMGKPQLVSKMVFVAVLINVGLNFALIPFYGIEGAAFATSASYLYILLDSTRHITHILKMKFPIKQWLKIVFPGISFLAVAYFIQNSISLNMWMEFFIAGFVATLFYFLLAYLFGAFNLFEIQKKLRRLKR